MKNKFLMFLLATSFVCKVIESEFPNERFISINYVFRCENDEVICYLFRHGSGYGGMGGMSCKFKDQSKKVGGK